MKRMIVCGCMGLLACGGDSPTTPAQYPYAFYAVTRGVNVLVNGTQQLQVVALDKTGQAFSDFPLTYESLDSAHVSVTATGVVTGRVVTTGNPVRVVIRGQFAGLTKVDTAFVRVTSTSFQLASFKIQPMAGNSFNYPLYTSTVLQTVVKDAGGNVVDPSNYTISWRLVQSGALNGPIQFSFDPVNSARFGGTGYGDGWVYASTTAYGVTAIDSVHIMIVDPTVIYFNFSKVGTTFRTQPGTDNSYPLQAGYRANFCMGNTIVPPDTVGITFTPDIPEGHIPGFSATYDPIFGGQQVCMARTFPTVGKYKWKTTRTPADSGYVVVHPTAQ